MCVFETANCAQFLPSTRVVCVCVVRMCDTIMTLRANNNSCVWCDVMCNKLPPPPPPRHAHTYEYYVEFQVYTKCAFHVFVATERVIPILYARACVFACYKHKAPEILQNKAYSAAADMWSLGVLAFTAYVHSRHTRVVLVLLTQSRACRAVILQK